MPHHSSPSPPSSSSSSSSSSSIPPSPSPLSPPITSQISDLTTSITTVSKLVQHMISTSTSPPPPPHPPPPPPPHPSSPLRSCEETYGLLPCSNSASGNLFLIIVYGYLMYMAASYLSEGSELMMGFLGRGIVGGVLLPFLGALPDAMLILVSGLSGSKETAQSQVFFGMGLLTGSTVMILTLIWGTCVFVGKCDLQGSIAIDESDTKGFKLTESGVSTDIWTCYAAMLMTLSAIPCLIVQALQALNSTSRRDSGVLVGLILCHLLLISYCLYQVFQPRIQRRRIAYVKRKYIVSGFLKHVKRRALGRLLTDNGSLNELVLERLFQAIDEDKDNHLSTSELRAFVIGVQLQEMNLDVDDLVQKVMEDFDTHPDSQISFEEFKSGISRWLADINYSSPRSGQVRPGTLKYLTDFHEKLKREYDLLGVEDVEACENGVRNPKKTAFKAILMLLWGTIIAAIFANPLVDAVNNFSYATSIPSFFISFIALPLANSSDAVSAIIFASRKRKRTASLTFRTLYGAVTMNNVLCLAVFLALIYVRGLTWDFSSEMVIILSVCIVMGALGSFRTVFPLWTSLVAFSLYPSLLMLVYILQKRNCTPPLLAYCSLFLNSDTSAWRF
ncbi:hypothetical protein Ancab_025534 [Ancistrocladus abbreviatus]